MAAVVERILVLVLAASRYFFTAILELYECYYPPNRLHLRRVNMPPISDKLFELCQSSETVTSLSAKEKLAPGKASAKLFGSHGFAVHEQKPPKTRIEATAAELKRSADCAKFGVAPSDKFLRIWHDTLATLEHDPLNGVASPNLLGSCGSIPYSIIGPLPDICRHMSNLIARAQHEVILATNYWKESQASTLITDSIRELSRRAGARNQRAVVKIIYDRGSPKQFVKNHLEVKAAERVADGIGLPSDEDIPHVDLQVINYHRTVLGTFHAKFLVVDRKFAIVQSNNIQDNDNLEMATHLEGEIVDSLYDMACVTWHNELKPPLPLMGTPTSEVKIADTYSDPDFSRILDSNGQLDAAQVNNSSTRLPMHNPGDPHYDDSIAQSIRRLQSNITPASSSESAVQLITDHLNSATSQQLKPTAPDFGADESMAPLIPHAPHSAFPIALVNRKPWGALNHSSVNTPQNEAWLSAIRHAERTIFIQSPDINAVPLLPEVIAAVKRGVEVTMFACLGYNDLGELLPLQGGTNEMIFHGLVKKLSTPEEKKRLKLHFYVAKDQIEPLNNKFKQRSCHIKLLIVDGHIGIQGSGNQDTQSWFHSQEVNIMIESPSTCEAWMRGILRNQNTHLYGLCSQEDGVWRDKDGKEPAGSMGTDPGHFAWSKGIVGAIQRVRGKGGF